MDFLLHSFCFIQTTCLSLTSAWFQWAQCFKRARKLGAPLSLWRYSDETDWPWTAGLSLSETYPQICFLEYVVALSFYIMAFNDIISIPKRSCISWPHSSPPGIKQTDHTFTKNVTYTYIDTHLLPLVSQARLKCYILVQENWGWERQNQVTRNWASYSTVNPNKCFLQDIFVLSLQAISIETTRQK